MSRRAPDDTRDLARLEPHYERALALRAQGMTLYEIGAEMGIAHVTAGKYVQRALDRIRESTDAKAEDYRQLEIQRLDRLMLAHWDAAVNPVSDKDGIPSTKSAEFVLKCIKQRSDLLGLNAPVKVEASVSFQPQPMDLSVYTPEELDQLQGLLAKQAWGDRLLGEASDPVLDAEFSVDEGED